MCTKTIGVLGVETLEVTKTITQDGDSLVPYLSATLGKTGIVVEILVSEQNVPERIIGHNSILWKHKTDILNFLKGDS